MGPSLKERWEAAAEGSCVSRALCPEAGPLLLGAKSPLAQPHENSDKSSSSQTQWLWADMACVCEAGDEVTKPYLWSRQPAPQAGQVNEIRTESPAPVRCAVWGSLG